MSQLNSANVATPPQTQVLLTILTNQVSRTEACLEGLNEADLDVAPGADCQTLRGILKHLLELRGFQLFLLQSPMHAHLPKIGPAASLTEIGQALAQAANLVRDAIQSHDPHDWFITPTTPRPGPWSTDPTLVRFSRPLNDFTNHLGAIRAIRRMQGNPATRTQ